MPRYHRYKKQGRRVLARPPLWTVLHPQGLRVRLRRVALGIPVLCFDFRVELASGPVNRITQLWRCCAP